MERTLQAARPLEAGEIVFLGQNCLAPDGGLFGASPLRPGEECSLEGRLALRALGRGWRPGLETPALFGAWVEVTTPLEKGEHPLAASRDGLSLAWVTLSDKASQGLREDSSGPTIEAMAREALEIGFARGFVLPDELAALKALLTDLALVQGYDLILTTGGTGLGPRDITPEATLAVIEKRLPGFEQAMMTVSLTKTPHAGISRAVAGTLGGSVIVNMPGSRKAVRENLAAVLPALAHAVAKLQGDPADCGA